MADDDTTTTDEADEAEAPPEVERLHGVPVTYSRGQTVLHPAREELVTTVETLRDEGYNMCLDVTAVDYLEDPRRDLPSVIAPERFEVVVNLMSHSRRERLRLRVQVPENDPAVPTLFDIFPGSEALERETHDMFGIVFDGHPDLSRILMPETWEGHPLRKDFAVGSIPVQFKDAPGPR